MIDRRGWSFVPPSGGCSAAIHSPTMQRSQHKVSIRQSYVQGVDGKPWSSQTSRQPVPIDPQSWRNHEREPVIMNPTPPVGPVAAVSVPARQQSTVQAERALYALVSAGDRRAMDQLYILYYSRLAQFFKNMTVRADLVEALTVDTMFEVWKEEASLSTNPSVPLAIMRVAYDRVQKHFAETGTDERHAQRNAQHSTSRTTTDTLVELKSFLSKLSVEERAVMHLVHAKGHSRRETADIMTIACDHVDVLLRDVRAKAKRHFRCRPQNTNAPFLK
jgi:DNA-directed RNA polymerase specialized sigma24 family protein